MSSDVRIENMIVDHYRGLVQTKHPSFIHSWPVISGFNLRVGGLAGGTVWIFESTRNAGFLSSHGLGDISSIVGNPSSIGLQNIESLRNAIIKIYKVAVDGAVVFQLPNGNIPATEFDNMLLRHEMAMGVAPMRIFLSHKGADKPTVREFKSTLESLGFDPWLDEDAMTAGVELERGILGGFQSSCAVVFFITPRFKDESYLSSEINYAIRQKREKGDKFSIITIVSRGESESVIVPDLLKTYVWKEPSSQLEALQEILRALPIAVGTVQWR